MVGAGGSGGGCQTQAELTVEDKDADVPTRIQMMGRTGTKWQRSVASNSSTNSSPL
jgi:hypothetical protein